MASLNMTRYLLYVYFWSRTADCLCKRHWIQCWRQGQLSQQRSVSAVRFKDLIDYLCFERRQLPISRCINWLHTSQQTLAQPRSHHLNSICKSQLLLFKLNLNLINQSSPVLYHNSDRHKHNFSDHYMFSKLYVGTYSFIILNRQQSR